MTNSTILNATYDLTNIVSQKAVNNTAQWVADVNNALGGVLIITLLAAFGVVLFLLVRRAEGVSDSVAAVYSGFMTSVIGVFLFVINVAGDKLLAWVMLVPILVITGVAIGVNYFHKKF